MAVNVVWAPQPGSQMLFMQCPYWEVLLEGTRGGGKTDVLIMDFAQHVGQGYGRSWRGILFRKTYKQLAEVVNKCHKWFPQVFPGNAKWNATEYKWVWKTGEELLLRYMMRPSDYWEYHGHEYPWIGWEELTNWPTEDCYEQMKSCSRSAELEMPRKLRATCNPFGVGHNWVKKRFINPAPRGVPITEELGDGHKLQRVAIHSDIFENKILISADPSYVSRLKAIKHKDLKKAWLYGDWDIIAGGALDDVWDRDIHVIPEFKIPTDWYVDRVFDWGSSAPFSVLWLAESNGEQVQVGEELCTWPAGTLFLIAEWYGGTEDEKGLRMTNRQIATGVKERDQLLRGKYATTIHPGAADTSIYDVVNNSSIAQEMEVEGVTWTPARKGAGSRVNGLNLFRGLLENCKDRPMEKPGFFVFKHCSKWLEHIPVLARSEKNPEDVDSDQPDHDWDATRYRVLSHGSRLISEEIR